MDYSLLLEYIQGAMEESRVDPFVKMVQDPPAVTANSKMYEDMKRALDGFKSNEDTNKELINLSSYFDEWKRHNRILIDHVTSHQRASSTMTCGLVLDEGQLLLSDMRLVYEDTAKDGDKNLITTYVTTVSKETTSRGKRNIPTRSQNTDRQ